VPKCPKCEQDIDHLRVRVTEEYIKSYAGGNGVFDELDQLSATFDEWTCPSCYQRLEIADQDAADQFLDA